MPGSVYQGLQAVAGLRLGRNGVRESDPVKSVPQAFIDAVLPHVSSPVAAMIRLQLLNGMRPGEVVLIRGCHLETGGKVWLYRPESHKTAHHGHQRVIALGPQAQAILKPFLKSDMTPSLFSPRDAVEE